MYVIVTDKPMHALSDHTKPFLDNLFKRTSDWHNLTYRLHARSDLTGYTGKLGQVPTRNLANIIIKLWSHISGIRSSHLTDLVECVTQCHFCSHKCQRITGSLRSQCRRTAQTCIHLDHTIIIRIRIERILNVTLTDNTQVTDTFGWQFLQHFQLFVVQWTSRSYYDRFTGMNAQRIKILHACHCKAVIVRIADHLKLNLFPALQRLFYQNLFRESKRTFGQFQELFFIGTNTAAESSQCISRTNHHRIANASRSSDSIFHALHRLADRSFHLDFIEFLHKQVTVFRIHNSLNRST